MNINQIKPSDTIERKFVESFDVSDYEVLSHDDWVDICASNKTVEYELYIIKLENGLEIKCADDHIFMTVELDEVFAKDSYGVTLYTEFGPSKVISVTPTNTFEHMYDLSVSGDHTYYTNHILSHNTVTSALKFIWSLNFVQDTSIGICANIEKGANEVLHKMKQSFNKLPIWLQQGVTKWNVKSIYFENGSKCITSATNGDAFRGFSFVGGIDKNGDGHSTLYMDEVAFVDNWHSFADSVLPTVSSDPNANIIMTSTPNGMNHYYEMVKDARLMKSEYSAQEVRWNCLPERNEEWREKIIKTHGLVYFNQNFGGMFLGSSATLLNANTLEKLESREPIEHTDSFSVYQKPYKDGKYILLCDLASGTGGDYTVVQVIKILKNKFEQVAIFRSNTTPLLSMTSIIHSIAMKYNEAYVLFEINYGSEVASRLYYDIEYENLLTIALVNSVQTLLGFKGQFRLGLQVDTKIKASQLVSLKALIESNKLIINDNDTISELYNFIQKGTSFEADLGKHDDCVMSLALLGWLVNQESFKEIVNYDFISDYEAIKAEEVSDLLPANMFGTGSYAHDNDTSWLTT